MTTNEIVAKRVLQLMRERNMTQYRVEQRSGVYHSVMSRVLHNRNSTITLATVYKLANGFDMSLREFLDDDIFCSEDIEVE